VKRVVVAAVLASVVLAAILACPCAAMAVDAHGCCADDGTRIGPTACCRSDSGPAPVTPRATPAALPVVSLAPAAVSLAIVGPSSTPAFVSFPASPPRVLRI